MAKFYIDIKGARCADTDRDDNAARVENALRKHYGDDTAVIAAYLEHWGRLDAGDDTAEMGTDSWSLVWHDAQSGCFSDWARWPDNAVFEFTIAEY